eukprot:TRINITY_DN10904_c0_g1_i10.p4 TRINITY_DN10904_c0_g1~~TRINITY_DN10904_c0_g1_i10.p4  ORF type:complete len:122 (-),score=45.36 TRINITY_DN10904_c0_g1_i10:17-382(-)
MFDFFFFFNDTATTEIYTRSIVGSVRCVQETDLLSSEPTAKGTGLAPVSYTHLRAHETSLHLVCRLLLEKKKKKKKTPACVFSFNKLTPNNKNTTKKHQANNKKKKKHKKKRQKKKLTHKR